LSKITTVRILEKIKGKRLQGGKNMKIGTPKTSPL
jgi:hypothetical protein